LTQWPNYSSNALVPFWWELYFGRHAKRYLTLDSRGGRQSGNQIPIDMARTKKPKVQIKRQKVSLGWAYRVYIDGMYVGTGLTQASARESIPRMLAIYDRMNEVRKLSAIAASAKHHVT
jgi:hypothetical protein